VNDEQTPDLEHIASLAATFVESEYGKHLMGTLAQMHFSRHDQAETAKPEDLPRLMHEAAMIREITDFVSKEASLHTSKFFENLREEEAERAKDAAIAP
jgi:hypothetical protein